jgi:hypothetical protein
MKSKGREKMTVGKAVDLALSALKPLDAHSLSTNLDPLGWGAARCGKDMVRPGRERRGGSAWHGRAWRGEAR